MWPIRFVEGSQPGKRKKSGPAETQYVHQKLMGWWTQCPAAEIFSLSKLATVYF
jgi:hypothetical protein